MASGKGTQNHIHKYYKVSVGRGEVFACALPDCTHHQPAHLTKLLLGKKVVCWDCDKPFYMDDEALEMEKPVCALCRAGIKEMAEQLAKSDI